MARKNERTQSAVLAPSIMRPNARSQSPETNASPRLMHQTLYFQLDCKDWLVTFNKLKSRDPLKKAKCFAGLSDVRHVQPDTFHGSKGSAAANLADGQEAACNPDNRSDRHGFGFQVAAL